jgi:hypothetical protein
MRFLIFNMVVFLSIGYLFTAAPGQSDWQLARCYHRYGQSDSGISVLQLTAPKQVPAPEDKLAQSAVSQRPLPVAATQ